MRPCREICRLNYDTTDNTIYSVHPETNVEQVNHTSETSKLRDVNNLTDTIYDVWDNTGDCIAPADAKPVTDFSKHINRYEVC